VASACSAVWKTLPGSPFTEAFLVAPVSGIVSFLGLEYPQVTPSVVSLLSVNVMNHLSLLQFTAELSLGNVTMNGCARVGKMLVALLVSEESGTHSCPTSESRSHRTDEKDCGSLRLKSARLEAIEES
jgi:hypothetical protein